PEELTSLVRSPRRYMSRLSVPDVASPAESALFCAEVRLAFLNATPLEPSQLRMLRSVEPCARVGPLTAVVVQLSPDGTPVRTHAASQFALVATNTVPSLATPMLFAVRRPVQLFGL